MQKAYQHELRCGLLLSWGRIFCSIWAESGLLRDGRGKCCSESLFRCCSCPGSYLAQIRIAREEFLFSVACNSSLSFPISKFVGVQSMCFGVAPALLFQWIRESWKRCFPMPGNSSCCIRTTFLLLLSFSSLFVFLLLYVWIFSPLSCVARRCSGIADHTSSLQKYSSHRTCKAVSGRSSGFFLFTKHHCSLCARGEICLGLSALKKPLEGWKWESGQAESFLIV